MALSSFSPLCLSFSSCYSLYSISANQLHAANYSSAVCGNFREIVDNHEKENALNIVTEERTYQVFAESPEDAR